mmetsp:Transcript_22628/g.73860  ORF Transcript_22628/g.73860 Transcript_22628/m.73860 type:complete len:406 (-) Transcript_22628:460-1677(-)
MRTLQSLGACVSMRRNSCLSSAFDAAMKAEAPGQPPSAVSTPAALDEYSCLSRTCAPIGPTGGWPLGHRARPSSASSLGIAGSIRLRWSPCADRARLRSSLAAAASRRSASARLLVPSARSLDARACRAAASRAASTSATSAAAAAFASPAERRAASSLAAAAALALSRFPLLRSCCAETSSLRRRAAASSPRVSPSASCASPAARCAFRCSCAAALAAACAACSCCSRTSRSRVRSSVSARSRPSSSTADSSRRVASPTLSLRRLTSASPAPAARSTFRTSAHASSASAALTSRSSASRRLASATSFEVEATRSASGAPRSSCFSSEVAMPLYSSLAASSRSRTMSALHAARKKSYRRFPPDVSRRKFAWTAWVRTAHGFSTCRLKCSASAATCLRVAATPLIL